MNDSTGTSRKTETYGDAGVSPDSVREVQRDDAERHGRR